MRRPYPSYQHSGVEWLGQVPEHWEVAQVRRWFNIVNGGTPASGDESYWDGETVWLTPDDLGRNSKAWISESRRRITDEGVSNSSARVSPEGSIILSTRAPIGHIAITAVPAATNQGCRTLVPNPETDSSFAYYSLIASRSLLQALGKGTTFMELTPTELGGFRMARPPLDEQQAIAAFLYRQTAKIDVLVAKERLLLDRLAECRTALITRTVTKGLPPEAAREAGLNPNPPLKPSGVEWIGEVPEHWTDTLVKRCYDIQLGKMLQPESSNPHDLETPYLKAQNVQWHKVNAEEPPLMWASHEDTKRFGINRGDLLVCEGGEGGRAALLKMPLDGFIIQNALHRVRAKTNCNNGFLMYWLTALASSGWNEASNNKATIAHFTKGKFGALPISMPSSEEQRAIASFLDRQTERIDTLHWRVEAAIERLQEYRTALITAAVIGKIDVRDHDAVEMGDSRT